MLLRFLAQSKTPPPVFENQALTVSSEEKSTSQKSANSSLIYFSKDSENGNVYKMKIKSNADGSVDVTREIINGNPNATEALQVIIPGVPYTKNGDTILVRGIRGKVFYQIPFKPGEEPCPIVDGGNTGKFYCQKLCSDESTTTCITSDDGRDGVVGCEGSCTKCKAVSDGCGSDTNGNPTNFTRSGSIVIEATTINFID